MTPTITVIMPVRNGERYLEEALASLEQQTCSDIVLHVWDDGSTDNTHAILNRCLNHRLPGRVIGNEPIGIGKALARLVESAPTELIARMDADDLCDSERFAQQLVYMQAHRDVAVLGTQMQRIDGETGQACGQTQHPTDDVELRWQMRRSNPINHPTVMMRRSAVLACGNYRDLRPGQDDDLWLRLSQRHRFANLPNPLLTYREHAASITQKQTQSTATFRQRRLADCTAVFPGLAPAEANRLTTLLTQPDTLGVTRRDVALLNHAAEAFALRSGESADYFKASATFRDQLLNLRTRRWKSEPVIGKAWPIVKRSIQLTRRTTMKPKAAAGQPDTRGAA